MARTWTFGGMALLVGSIGCGAPSKAPITAWSEAGPVTTIEFEDDTSWPFEIASLKIVLDGEVLVAHSSPVGSHDKWGFEVPLENLPVGDHTLSVAIEARYASTQMDASEGCAVRWRQSRTFVVGTEPIGVRIVADTDQVTRRFVDRLGVDLKVAGARWVGEQHPPRRGLLAKSAVCRDDGPLPFGDHELSRNRFAPDPFR